MSERAPGYYWVQHDDFTGWKVAEVDKDGWLWTCGWEVPWIGLKEFKFGPKIEEPSNEKKDSDYGG